MILTIDLNPSIDRRYIVDEISQVKEIRAKSSFSSPGGSGITIARLLNIFNEKTLITGFLGGITGESYHRTLVEKDIIHKVITIKDESRTKIEIESKEDGKIAISENGPRITRDDLVAFYELYSQLLDKSNVVIGGSSRPQGVASDVYFNLINLANRKEKFFILHGGGEDLLKGIEAAPYAVVLSKSDLEKLVNLDFNFENEIIKASRYVLDKGVRLLIINLHEKGLIILEDSKGYRLELEDMETSMGRFNNIGIVVGLALGISRNYDFEMTLRLSQAFSIAYGIKDINELDMGDIKRFMNKIEIYPINQ